MIKEHIKRKFIITTLALIVFLVTMSFPSVEEEIKNNTISYTSGTSIPIYLLDPSTYVSRTEMNMMTNETENIAREIIEILTIQGKKSEYIPSLFTPVLPKDTKILSLDLQDTIIKINFSKEFFNVPLEYEEKMLECLVYSLTEIKEIDGVIIFVEGKLLEELPQSKKKVPPLLTRDIGVNKVYHLESLKNVNKTTIYYIAKNQNMSYYVPVTLLENNEKNKVEIIIERLKSLPTPKANLMSFLNASTELSHYELLEQEVILSFSDLLYEGLASDEILEEVKYSIALSVKDSLNVKEVTFVE